MTEKKFFGTDGVRGRVGGSVINADVLTKLGLSIGAELKSHASQKPLVLVGRDTRISGESLQKNLQDGLIHAGVDVALLGVLSTPAIAYLTKQLKAQAGIVISASHNPYEDNGVKVIGGDGFKLSDAWELSIEQKMQQEIKYADEKGTVISIDHASEKYIAHCLDLFPSALKDYRLVLDCANGATFECAPKIFSQLQAQVISMHHQPNGKNINAHCGATDVKSLQQKVLAEKAHCGIAFDGDGDRLIMVDEKGEIVDGDEILCVLATDENASEKAVVGTLMSNLGLQKALESRGIHFERAAVGDRYVLEKLLKNNWCLGGEASGHIVNLNYATTGDGVITALQVLQVMQRTQKTLSELKSVMKKRPQILVNVPVKDPNRFADIPEIINATATFEKSLNSNGRILLRASGTESCVRVMVECDDAIDAKNIAESLATVVRENLKPT